MNGRTTAHSTGMFKHRSQDRSVRKKMKSRCIRGGEAADANQVDDHLCHNCSSHHWELPNLYCAYILIANFRTTHQTMRIRLTKVSTRAKARAHTNWGYPQLLPAVYIERDECERETECKSYFWSRLSRLYKIDANPRQCRRHTACRFSSFNYFFAD